jgi:hypothetical protein
MCTLLVMMVKRVLNYGKSNPTVEMCLLSNH